jgi:hypothetical protein
MYYLGYNSLNLHSTLTPFMVTSTLSLTHTCRFPDFSPSDTFILMVAENKNENPSL